MSTKPEPFSLSLARDVRNLLQALVALRFKRVYLPSLFAYYTVNSACNLRCSYCYIAQPEIFPQGFANAGLPLERAKRVLATLRRESLFLRFLGGEPTIYKPINELARYAKRELRYWHTSLITNGVLLARHPERYEPLLQNIDVITISLDQTRLSQYPYEMEQVLAFLPRLAEICTTHRITLTCNYTATWEELEQPQRVERAVEKISSHFASIYINPVRQAGKTPLPLLRNALALNRRYSFGLHKGFSYPEREHVAWYRDHCDPKLKLKIDADGGLVYPCENHSYSAGSLETHTIRELWSKELIQYPNDSCLGCGKQRFRSHTLKHPGQLLKIVAYLRGHGAAVARQVDRGQPPRPRSHV